jgi:hypothetical protein
MSIAIQQQQSVDSKSSVKDRRGPAQTLQSSNFRL